MFIRLICWLLKGTRLSPEQRLLLTNEVLSTIGSLPLHSIITADAAGNLLIRGKTVEKDQALLLRESALNVLKSPAYQIVREQVLRDAITYGVHQGVTTDQMQFGKAAIWFGEQEINLFKVFAGESGNLPHSEDY